MSYLSGIAHMIFFVHLGSLMVVFNISVCNSFSNQHSYMAFNVVINCSTYVTPSKKNTYLWS
jgi:hypothetical protein